MMINNQQRIRLDLFSDSFSYFGLQNIYRINMLQRYLLAVRVLPNLRTSQGENSNDQRRMVLINFILFFWALAPGQQRFGRLYCPHLQGSIWYPSTRRYVCGTVILKILVLILTAKSQRQISVWISIMHLVLNHSKRPSKNKSLSTSLLFATSQADDWPTEFYSLH